jgi:hypothetical protein
LKEKLQRRFVSVWNNFMYDDFMMKQRRLTYSRMVFAMIASAAVTSPALAGEPLKPYVVFILDTSGSMNQATGSGPPSCVGEETQFNTDTKLNHAKCAINRIANSYGDMVFALGRFRHTSSGVFSSNCATDCSLTNFCSPGEQSFELLSSLVDGNNSAAASFSDGLCNTCSPTGVGNVEIYGTSSGTPIAGSLLGAQRYWQGLQHVNSDVIWPANSTGFSPIANDPTKNVFLSPGNQCRPYITIMMTDGNETCGGNGVTAATSLLNTTVAGKNYRISTKPIGFGIPPGDTDIEALAHAGGTADVAGVNEGAYASNEEELQIAVSRIIADAVRSERCNELDDDCDTLIDEDFPSKGGTCNNGLQGVCRGTGVFVCTADGSGTQCNITNPGGNPSAEVCDGIDNDCDGLVDEDACTGCGDVEICNNRDDDCDNRIDEDLTRGCGSSVGECRPGVETCAAGNWGSCTGVNPTTEVCDGRDNDCDGSRDGLSEACSSLPGGNPNVGICRPGIRTCPPGGAGTFGACLGEIVPRTESCNLLDDDCDGTIDESTGGAACASACGVGVTVCVNGTLQCNSTQSPNDETCDGNDDDCDGIIDENAPDMGACDANGTICGGVNRCVSGRYQCTGGLRWCGG